MRVLLLVALLLTAAGAQTSGRMVVNSTHNGSVYVRPLGERDWVLKSDHTPASVEVDPQTRYDVRVQGDHSGIFWYWEGLQTGQFAGTDFTVTCSLVPDVARITGAVGVVAVFLLALAVRLVLNYRHRMARLQSSHASLQEYAIRKAAFGGDPDQIGPYTILKTLGKGGQGRVFHVRHKTELWEGALKIPSPDADMQRFENELTILNNFRHPGIVRLLDYQPKCEMHPAYFVMELVDQGELLSHKIDAEAPMGLETAGPIVRNLLSALSYTHERGIIHRDLSPNNIFVLPGGTVKIVDFGISKNADNKLTQVTTAFGTMEYAAPEQLMDSRRATPATDLYTVGVVLYEMLTGAVPFKADDFLRLMQAKLNGLKVLPHQVNPSIPQALSRVVIARLLQPDPDNRPQSAEQVLQLWDQCMTGKENEV